MASKSLTLIFLFFFVSDVFGAACCGAGASLPNLINGDYRAQVSIAGSNAAVTHDSDSSGAIKERDGNNQEVLEVLTLTAAYLISPYWQTGITIPYKFHSHKSRLYQESSNGLGDIKAQVAYEFLPETLFSVWRPKGLIFIEQSIASSKSIYTANKPLRSDSFGSGFYTTAIGVSLMKTINSFDFLLLSEIHQGFKRSFEAQGQGLSEALKVTPGLGGSVLLGAGLSPFNGNFRLGQTLLYSREGKRRTERRTSSSSKSNYFLELGFSASYLFSDVSLSIGFQDQSFLGQASNTSLSKLLSASVVKFFDL